MAEGQICPQLLSKLSEIFVIRPPTVREQAKTHYLRLIWYVDKIEYDRSAMGLMKERNLRFV